MIDPEPEPRALLALREQVDRSRRCAARAEQRLQRARDKQQRAAAALSADIARLDQWLVENPQSQIEMAV